MTYSARSFIHSIIRFICFFTHAHTHWPDSQISVCVVCMQMSGGRVMRRVSSVPSRASSPVYAPSPPPSRPTLGSPYGSPIISEPRPLPSVFPGTMLPPSSDPLQSSYPGHHRDGMSSPTLLRSGMTAQPQHYGTLGKHDAQAYDNTHSSFGARAYDFFERIVLSRPDSLTGEWRLWKYWNSLLK